MTARIPFAETAPSIAIDGEAALHSVSAGASPDVLLELLVPLPGSDDGAGSPMYVRKYVRLSDLASLCAAKEG